MLENQIELYTSAEARLLDLKAMEIDKPGEGALMERAGDAAYRHLRFLWPRARRITVVCGPGNNGGDGYVLARKLIENGLTPVLYSIGKLEKQTGDALQARIAFEKAGGKVLNYEGGALIAGEVIVDALLGTGSERNLQGEFAEVVEVINDSQVPILALDQPSGIDASCGKVLGTAIKASATVTFIGIKRGLLTSSAVDHVGQLFFADLGISDKAREQISTEAQLLSRKTCQLLVPHRKQNTHKGEQGKLLIVGGAPGMTGAARLAGMAALRSGAGLVRIASLGQPDATSPELMVTQVHSASELGRLLELSDGVVIGPGLGRDALAQQLLGKVLESRSKLRSLVVDADALTCLGSQSIDLAGAVLTPHPGEAAMLLSSSASSVQVDRFAAASEIATRFNCTCVLKGAGTIISDGKRFLVSDRGGPELASAGTGDVLSGIIAALSGQGLNAWDAASLGVFIHGAAGELAARKYSNGLIASDLYVQVPEILRWFDS